MGATTVSGILIPNFKSVLWRNVQVTASGAGLANPNFGTFIGTAVYYIRVRKTTAPTLLDCLVTPRYDNNNTIPENLAQAIPCDMVSGGNETFAFFPLNPNLALILAISGLDAAGVYNVSVGTNFDYSASQGSC